MERALSREEKIRKAEEIYCRRKNLNTKSENIEDTNIQKRYRWIRRLLTQILLSMCIYMIFSVAQDNKIKYSNVIIDKTKQILTYNMDFTEYYNGIKKIFYNKEKVKEDEILIEDNEVNTSDESKESNEEDTIIETVSGVSQMTNDADYIKSKVNMIKPLSGTITSKFGVRDDVGSSYHLGLDIGAEEKTEILAAIPGVVQIVSSEGNYGNHIKIVNDDISTLYAHCSSMFVQEGASVTQGQKIAEVGSTGYSTGPHLHFEIMCEDRYVDPELLLDF